MANAWFVILATMGMTSKSDANVATALMSIWSPAASTPMTV